MATHSGALTWRIPMDRGAWWATAHEVAESDTPEQLNTQLLYNIVMVFAKHQHQPQVYVRLPHPKLPSTALSILSIWVVPALGTLLQALNFQWSSSLHMVKYMF